MDSLSDEVINKYITAFSHVSRSGKIIVGRDGRPSGIDIEKKVIEQLNTCGRDVVSIGMAPTPTVQLLVEKLQAAGGIAITASHNPSEWNGMKFVNSGGVFFDASENESLWQEVDSGSEVIKNAKRGAVQAPIDALQIHIDSILGLPFFQSGNLLYEIQHKNYKVVVDSVNSSGSVFVPYLLKKLGCEVIELFCDGTGLFPHTPEPLPENLTQLAAAVAHHKADIGIAVDPDADRLVLIDENGNAIGEELTIVLAVESILMSFDNYNDKYNKSVVVNHSTTRLVEDIAEKFIATVHRSSVGEINVVKLMKQTNAVIGGEGSGGVILPACHYGRDSLVGIALLLKLLAQKNTTLSSICADYPIYKMRKIRVPFEGSLDNLIQSVAEQFPDSQYNFDDGVKIINQKSWVQLRKSNTEPIIRIIAETPFETDIEIMIDKIRHACEL